MDQEELLGEVEDLLRTMPQRDTLHHFLDENYAWIGRAGVFVERWCSPKRIFFDLAVSQLQSKSNVAVAKILTLLHEARHDLRLDTIGPVNTAVGHGSVFDYFDEIRKIIEPATEDLLFIDPYLDADFVARYLPHVSHGVTVRLLAREKLPSLIPAADLFSRQNGIEINVRSTAGFHDRYVVVDRAACYQSGASFKDGAKTAPTTLTQITDAFTVVLQTYENLWRDAKVER